LIMYSWRENGVDFPLLFALHPHQYNHSVAIIG
jgi:hypothetical protein